MSFDDNPTALNYAPKALECASRHDSRWFAKRPGKQFRFRPARAGEAPGALLNDWVITRQFAPGQRGRLTVRINGTRADIARQAPSSDDELAKLWVACLNGHPFQLIDGRVFTLREVHGH